MAAGVYPNDSSDIKVFTLRSHLPPPPPPQKKQKKTKTKTTNPIGSEFHSLKK